MRCAPSARKAQGSNLRRVTGGGQIPAVTIRPPPVVRGGSARAAPAPPCGRVPSHRASRIRPAVRAGSACAVRAVSVPPAGSRCPVGWVGGRRPGRRGRVRGVAALVAALGACPAGPRPPGFGWTLPTGGGWPVAGGTGGGWSWWPAPAVPGLAVQRGSDAVRGACPGRDRWGRIARGGCGLADRTGRCGRARGVVPEGVRSGAGVGHRAVWHRAVWHRAVRPGAGRGTGGCAVGRGGGAPEGAAGCGRGGRAPSSVWSMAVRRVPRWAVTR